MSERYVIRHPKTNEPIMAFCAEKLTDNELAAMTEYAVWMHDKAAELITPEVAARQDAARKRNHERLERIRAREAGA